MAIPARHRGSISAEHGLGFKKSQYIYHTKSREAVYWMKRIKQLFDPNVRGLGFVWGQEDTCMELLYIAYQPDKK